MGSHVTCPYKDLRLRVCNPGIYNPHLYPDYAYSAREGVATPRPESLVMFVNHLYKNTSAVGTCIQKYMYDRKQSLKDCEVFCLNHDYCTDLFWLSRYCMDRYPLSRYCVDMCLLSIYCMDRCPHSRYCVDTCLHSNYCAGRFCWFLAVSLINTLTRMV